MPTLRCNLIPSPFIHSVYVTCSTNTGKGLVNSYMHKVLSVSTASDTVDRSGNEANSEPDALEISLIQKQSHLSV